MFRKELMQFPLAFTRVYLSECSFYSAFNSSWSPLTMPRSHTWRRCSSTNKTANWSTRISRIFFFFNIDFSCPLTGTDLRVGFACTKPVNIFFIWVQQLPSGVRWKFRATPCLFNKEIREGQASCVFSIPCFSSVCFFMKTILVNVKLRITVSTMELVFSFSYTQ